MIDGLTVGQHQLLTSIAKRNLEEAERRKPVWIHYVNPEGTMRGWCFLHSYLKKTFCFICCKIFSCSPDLLAFCPEIRDHGKKHLEESGLETFI